MGLGFLDAIGFGGGGAANSVFGSITGTNGPNTSQYMGNPDLTQYGQSPYSSALMDSINGMQKFQNITPGSVSAPGSTYSPMGSYVQDAYKAKDMSNTALPQYDAMRSRLNSQYAQTQGASQDAIDRQFAAMGGGPGNGAQLKQTENLESNIARQKGDDLMGINAEEANTRTGLQQQEAQKEFQSQEAQKGYGFQAGQADIGRQFAAGESAAGRQMQAGEFNVGQDTQTKQFNAQMGQHQDEFRFDANSKIAALSTAWDEAQNEARGIEFNKVLAEWQARHTGGVLGGGGFLGSGLFS